MTICSTKVKLGNIESAFQAFSKVSHRYSPLSAGFAAVASTTMKWHVQVRLCELISFRGLASLDYRRIKGDALKEVLKPVPPKEPAEALRCLEVINGFSVEFVAHEPLVFNPVAAALEENGVIYVVEFCRLATDRSS